MFRRYGIATASNIRPNPEIVEKAFTWWGARSAADAYNRLSAHNYGRTYFPVRLRDSNGR